MKAISTRLTSVFADDIQRYFEREHARGLNFRVERSILRAFDRYVSEVRHVGPLTQDLAVNFAYSRANLTSVQHGRRYGILRRFAEFLAIFDSDAPVLHPQAVKGKSERHPAHIYTTGEIALLLQVARSLGPAGSLRPLTYCTLIGLLVSTGLRISEAINLDTDDVDLNTAVLRVRNTKFRKSRLVPVHSSTCAVLQEYQEKRNSLVPILNSPAFFISQRRSRLTYGSVVATFIACARQAGIRNEVGRGPRIHDLRHTFAVKRVLAWYRDGDDVQSKLSLLADYMGHAHFEDTTYYLTAGSEIMAEASKRFGQPQEGGDL